MTSPPLSCIYSDCALPRNHKGACESGIDRHSLVKIKAFVVTYRCTECRCAQEIDVGANALRKMWRECGARFPGEPPTRRCRGTAIIVNVQTICDMKG